MLTGVPQHERWWLWALGVWIFFSLGPGLEIGSQATYIGYFPMLYVWSVLMWGCSIVLAYFLAFKLTFHEVPTDIISIHDEQEQGGAQ